MSVADIILLLILIVLIYHYFTRNFNYWKSRGVPYKKPVFFFGNFLDVALGNDHAGKHVEKLYNKFDGPYFGFYALNTPYLVLKDPELIKRIMIKDFQVFPNRFFYCDPNIDPAMGYSLLGIKNPHWKSLRMKLSPIFTSGKMKMMMPLMKECGENLQNFIKTVLDEKAEAKEIAGKYTTDVIATCAFGISANSFVDPNSEFRVAGRKLAGDSFYRYIQALSYSFAHLLVKLFRFKFIEAEAANFLSRAFLDTIEQRESSKIKRNDLIDILIDLKNQEAIDDDFKFYGDKLVAQAIIFFSAGHETTSSTIAFTLHELCINTDIQERLRNEIEDIIEKHGELTYEAIQDMEYLHMVVSETLRKYPLTPFIQRECVEDYEIPETGLVIERGTPVVIPQHGLHWDPKYFPNPEKYDPERFNDKNKLKLTPFTYVPFGDGPRNCIGERFALLNSKLGIIDIIKHFKVEKNSETKEPLTFCRSDLLQAKGGIRVTFREL